MSPYTSQKSAELDGTKLPDRLRSASSARRGARCLHWNPGNYTWSEYDVCVCLCICVRNILIDVSVCSTKQESGWSFHVAAAACQESTPAGSNDVLFHCVGAKPPSPGQASSTKRIKKMGKKTRNVVFCALTLVPCIASYAWIFEP